jgi:hypothetical protein
MARCSRGGCARGARGGAAAGTHATPITHSGGRAGARGQRARARSWPAGRAPCRTHAPQRARWVALAVRGAAGRGHGRGRAAAAHLAVGVGDSVSRAGGGRGGAGVRPRRAGGGRASRNAAIWRAAQLQLARPSAPQLWGPNRPRSARAQDRSPVQNTDQLHAASAIQHAGSVLRVCTAPTATAVLFASAAPGTLRIARRFVARQRRPDRARGRGPSTQRGPVPGGERAAPAGRRKRRTFVAAARRDEAGGAEALQRALAGAAGAPAAPLPLPRAPRAPGGRWRALRGARRPRPRVIRQPGTACSTRWRAEQGPPPTPTPQNSEIFTLTYGSIVRQLISDFEDLEEVNKQLDQM